MFSIDRFLALILDRGSLPHLNSCCSLRPADFVPLSFWKASRSGEDPEAASEALGPVCDCSVDVGSSGGAILEADENIVGKLFVVTSIEYLATDE